MPPKIQPTPRPRIFNTANFFYKTQDYDRYLAMFENFPKGAITANDWLQKGQCHERLMHATLSIEERNKQQQLSLEAYTKAEELAANTQEKSDAQEQFRAVVIRTPSNSF